MGAEGSVSIQANGILVESTYKLSNIVNCANSAVTMLEKIIDNLAASHNSDHLPQLAVYLSIERTNFRASLEQVLGIVEAAQKTVWGFTDFECLAVLVRFPDEKVDAGCFVLTPAANNQGLYMYWVENRKDAIPDWSDEAGTYWMRVPHGTRYLTISN